MPISAVFAYIDVTPQMYRDKMPTSSKNRHPKLIGDSSAAHILARLVDHFVGVYIPWGENTRADFIVDDGERLLRIQAKTGRLREGAIRFPNV